LVEVPGVAIDLGEGAPDLGVVPIPDEEVAKQAGAFADLPRSGELSSALDTGSG